MMCPRPARRAAAGLRTSLAGSPGPVAGPEPTLHQARGLSADAVFIVAAEDEYIPGRAAGMHWEMSGGSCTCQRPGLGITSTARTAGDGLAPKHTAGEQLTGVHTSEPSKPNARLTAAQPLYREWRASMQSTRHAVRGAARPHELTHPFSRSGL